MSSPVRPYPLPKPQFSPSSYHSTAHMMGDNNSERGITTFVNDYRFFETKKFKICFLAMSLNVVLFALDQFIVVTAVPQIVSEFEALDQIEWLNTAFFVPCAGMTLIYTQVMTIADPKWTYLFAIFVFEAGSAVCGAAQSMNMLIAGRAITGAGGAGMWSATYLIGSDLIPFEKRPGLFGLFGISYIFASILGPLIGGAFTDTGPSGWRWCFYINLPIGGVTLGLLFLTMPSIPRLLPFDGVRDSRPVLQKLLRIDWVGAVLTFGFVICFGMGLQWGGVTKDWNDVAVIVTLALALVFFLALNVWSIALGSRAMVPMSLFKSRHFTAGAWVSFFGYGVIVVYLYYLPLYFEAIKDKSATRAGVLLLALQLTMCPILVIVGKVGELTGQAKYPICLGSCLVAVASGLLTTLKTDTSIGTVIGFQILAGFGVGMLINIVVVLVQSIYLNDPHLVTHATNVFNFWGFIGRIVAMSTVTNIFNNKLRLGLSKIDSLATDSGTALKAEIAAAPKSIWTALPGSLRSVVLDVYSSSLAKTFWVALAMSIACLLSGLMMDNINLKRVAEEARLAREAANSPSYPMKTASRSRGKDEME